MENNQKYKILCDGEAPKTKTKRNLIFSFLIGGGICFFGQWLFFLYTYLGAEDEDAYLYVTLSFIFLSSLATALGFFDRIAAKAGAGTLVPVTGFSNSVTSSAIDNRSEGYVSGVGSKIFTVAGPVILFATLSGSLYGIVYFLCGLLF